MGTVWIIQTAFGDQEIFQNLPFQNGPRDDPGYIFQRDLTVPDALGIDDDGRAMLALIETTRVIGPGQRPQPRFLELGLESLAERLAAFGVTTPSFVARRSNITADKDVVREGRHVLSVFLVDSSENALRRAASVP